MMDRIPDALTCERGSDLIAFLYGEIGESETQEFERHLMNCVECESELGAFKQVRLSVVAWRQESLAGASETSGALSPAVGRVVRSGKPSAMAAIRSFFELSPLWMKASIACASVLFCVVSVVALAHLFANPKPVVVAGEEKRYTEKELQAKIEDAVKSGLQSQEAPKLTAVPIQSNSDERAKLQRGGHNRSVERFAAIPNVKRGPLTKVEREQLAADLRLIIPQDDTDLDLLGDGNNR